MPTRTTEAALDPAKSLSRRHLLAGWAGLLIFLSLGIVLETLHGLKLNGYLDPRLVTRRLLWTLAHAHGTLFSLIQIAFAVSLNHLQVRPVKALQLVSRCLIGALIAMPLGLFLGGLWLYGGDPGLGVVLVPLGALLLLVAAGIFLGLLYLDRHDPVAEARDRPSSGPDPSRMTTQLGPMKKTNAGGKPAASGSAGPKS